MTTTTERVKIMMKALELDQPSFGKIAGATKSVVNQWLTGKIKSIGPEYAYNIAKKTNFCAEWIMLGTGDVRQNEKTLRMPSTVAKLKPPTERETATAELVALASQLDLLRLGMLIKTARDLSGEMPAQQMPPSTG